MPTDSYPGKPGQLAVHRDGNVAVLSHRKTQKESIHPGWWLEGPGPGAGGLSDYALNGPDWMLVDPRELFQLLTLAAADTGDEKAVTTFAQMIEGPKHIPHIRQVQVGWLGQTGAFYPWPTEPGRADEPGSYMPVYIDEDEGPELICVYKQADEPGDEKP